MRKGRVLVKVFPPRFPLYLCSKYYWKGRCFKTFNELVEFVYSLPPDKVSIPFYYGGFFGPLGIYEPKEDLWPPEKKSELDIRIRFSLFNFCHPGLIIS